MENLFRKVIAPWLIFVFVLVSCAPAPILHSTEVPPDGWSVANPTDVGIDADPLAQLLDRIQDGGYENIHGILVVKDGKLVFEEYFHGYKWDFNGEGFRGEATDYDAATRHNLASVTKSFTSTLIGIAIDQGLIRGVDEKVFDYFPEYAHLRDKEKDTITLEHLLTMTSGLEWNGMDIHVSTRDPENDLIQLFVVSDPIEYILAKPLVDPPGSRWYYNGGGTNLLGAIIRKATGMRTDEFAEEHLFAPLGITNYEWDFINHEVVHASGNLALWPRDMAKLGVLFLNDGVWGGERIVSEAWVRNSTTHHADVTWGEGYGYQWWLRTYHAGSRAFESYYAAGWGGQRIIVFPELEMVVVFTGGNYVSWSPVDEMIEDYILPAVE